MIKTGAQIVMECLIEQGVDTVFGYPGGTVIDLYDALYEYSDKINHVLAAHEQHAAHAADGYARSTGRCGVCFATSGPGATNLVTGLSTAYMDSIPMVAITGNVNINLLGTDAFQEIDIYGVSFPITKYSFIVKDQKDIAKTLREAFYIAQEGRPGPVLVDILKNAQAGTCEYEPQVPRAIVPKTRNIKSEDLATAAKLINESERPMIFAGGGAIASNCSENLMAFAEMIGSPISLSMMGLGACSSDYPYFTGMLGMHGTRVSAKAVSNCDLLIVAGARMSERVTGNAKTFAKHAKVLHIDVDPAEIDKVLDTTTHVAGDLNEVLKALMTQIDKKDDMTWRNQILTWKKEFPPIAEDIGSIPPARLIRKIADKLPKDSIVVTDVGQHQIWTAQYYPIHYPRTFLSSGGLGTMGYGVGASIGAKKGNPNKKVVLFTGDGSFQMNCNEVITAATQKMDILIVVVNNHVLGMVRQWQKLMYHQHYSQTTTNRKIDYVKLAEAFGAKGYNVSTMEELDAILDEAISQEGPVILNANIDMDVNVLPMVPPGNAYNQQIFSIEV
ncbi:MAG: biosynthetic-type acetolactate synthase large subunit [Firmicutes bacterium]|nr:biosynthetic-type acetolactate synthase large subunit [Bacillota bacterium]